jgi:hypothetical protein
MLGATHFLMRSLLNVSTEMAINVLACNMKRVMALVGVSALAAIITLELERSEPNCRRRKASGPPASQNIFRRFTARGDQEEPC